MLRNIYMISAFDGRNRARGLEIRNGSGCG